MSLRTQLRRAKRLLARLRPAALAHTIAPQDVWPDAARMAVAAIATFAATKALHLQGGYFSVLIALMTARPSAAGLKGVLDRLVGTALGIVVGLALSLLHRFHVPEEVLVAIAMIPLCYVVARLRKYQVAPMAAIVVLSGAATMGHALEGAGLRILEVCLGAAIGLAVSAVVFRRTTDRRSRGHAADALQGCGALMVAATAGGPAARDAALRARIRGDLRLVVATSRMLRSRGQHLGTAHIAGLNRLQADLIFYERALAETRRLWRGRAGPVLMRLANSFHTLCAEAAAFLLHDAPPPDFGSFDGALLALQAVAGQHGRAAENAASAALPFLLQRLRADLADLLAGYPPPLMDVMEADGAEIALIAPPVRALAQGG